MVPGFPIRATITDVNGVMRTELWIDNAKTMDMNFPPYVYNAPGSLDEGTHRVEVRAWDTQDTMSSTHIDVIIGEPCETPGDCIESEGEGYTCVGGRCVPGPGSVGGLGEICVEATECYSGVCATDGTESRCVESCTPDAGECPGGFGCRSNGAGGGVCWPGAEDGGGGCLSTNPGDAGLPILFGLGFAAMRFVPRRRRRARA